MKPFVKRTILLCLTFLMLFVASCAEKKEKYVDNIPCEELMKSVETMIPTDLGYTSFGTEQILYYFENTKAYDDVCLRYSTRSENINEIGIFHSSDEASRKELEDTIKGYLGEMWEEQREFIASYAPEELPKLEYAEIQSFGNYTVYAILSEADKDAVFEVIKEHLSQK